VRRRYLRSTLLIVVLGMSVLAVVMAIASSNGIRGEAQDRLSAEAERIESIVHQRLDAGLPVDAEFADDVAPADRALRIVLPSGEVLETGAVVGSDALQGTSALNLPGGGSVTVLEGPARVRQSQLISTLSIVAIVLVVGAIAAVVAVRESRRLARPLAELADRAARLGSGDLRTSGDRYGIPELDRVAEALDDSAVELNRAAEQSRSRIVDVSHQLRTPLTALSMRLEEIRREPNLGSVRREAVAALEQLERLTGVVETMLVGPRAFGRAPAETRLDAVVRQQLVEWMPSYELAGRDLSFQGEPDVVVKAPNGSVSQVLATLLENSLRHGGGATTVMVRHSEGAVVVEVADEGEGVPAALVPRVFERSVSGSGGSGVGLALARATAESVGGRLELTTSSPPTFALFLHAAG